MYALWNKTQALFNWAETNETRGWIPDSDHVIKDARFWKQPFGRLTYQFMFFMSNWYTLQNKHASEVL
jgi:uncharacterized protein YhdP